MTKQELKAKIDKLENGIKSKATPSNLIAPLKAQKAKFEKELEQMESAEKKAVKTKKVSKVAEKIKAAKKSVAKKTPAKAPAKEERKKDNIARDGDRKSLRSGKRISKSGKVYYETRANRSDKQTSKKPYLAKGGELTKYNVSFNYNPSNLSNEDAEKIASEYTKNWNHNNDFDEVSFYVLGLSKENADMLVKQLKMEDAYNIEVDKSDYADGGKLPNGKYKYEKGDEGMFQGDEIRVVKYHNGDRTYEYNIIDEDGNVKTHGVAKAEKFENQFRYFPKMADGGEIDWGADLGGGFSIGNDVVITERNSEYKGKEGVIIGKEGDKLIVDITSMTPTWLDAKTLISMDGVERLDAPEYAKGGIVVTSIKDIPNFEERLEQGRITYRGLGMGKLANDFYDIAGTGGTRIKVDGKEYFITDEEFNTFNRGADGRMRVRFAAPARRGYAKGGDLSEAIYLEGTGWVMPKTINKLNEDGVSEPTMSYEPIESMNKKNNELKNKDMNYAKGGDVKKHKVVTSKESYANDLLKYADLQNIPASSKMLGNKFIVTFDAIPKAMDSMTQDVKDLVNKMDKGGYMAEGGELNLLVRKMASQKGLTPKKLGSDYELIMAQAVVDAFTDANYHDAARKLVSILEKKPEIAVKPDYPSPSDPEFKVKFDAINEKYDSKYWHGDEKTRDFAVKVSQNSGWDGNGIAGAFEYLLRMEGYHRLADNIKKSIELSDADKIADFAYENDIYATGNSLEDFSRRIKEKSGTNYADEDLKVAYNLLSNVRYAKGGYMAHGGKVAKSFMMGKEEVYIKDSSIGIDDEVCLFYKKDDSILKCISKNSFDAYVEQGKLKPKMADGGMFEAPITKYWNTIKDFYINTYPTDDLGQEINGEATFDGLNRVLDCNINVYEYIGVGDSIVRERLFEKLAELEGVNYDVIYNKWLASDYAKGGYMADGGESEVDRKRMYNFLKDDLAELEEAIEQNNQEEIERFFSYWNIHLKSLEPMTGSKRMYEFLKDDLVGLEAATKELPSSKEETDRFFSYWNTHLKSLEFAKGGYMADGGQVPAHFGSGKNIEVFGYETKNFDICATAVKEFEAAVDIMKDSKELEKESLAYCAKYVDNLFGIEKVVVEGGIGGELNFSHAVSDIMSASTYNFRAGMAINLYSFVPQHLMEIALRLAKAEKGGFYALGGMTAGRWYKDKSGEEFKFIGKIDSGANKGRFLFSDGQKSVYKELEDFEGGKPKETKLFGFFEEGGMLIHGFQQGDTILEIYKGYGIVENKNNGVIEVLNPNRGTRFIIDLDESKPTGRKSMGMSKDEQMESAKRYIDYLDKPLPDTLLEKFRAEGKMEKGGYMADGGQIKDQYQGKSPDYLWNNWTEKQREHFNHDHDLVAANDFRLKSSFDELPEFMKKAISEHYKMGQYAYGGYMADGGMMDVVNAEISTIKRNIMGTTSFVMKIKGMRNPQDFIVYPISADQAGQPIMIQSDTRIGFLDLSSGRGLMSQSHANGAYRHHFTMDKKVPFKISETDLQRLKEHISGTAGSSVGNMGISSDNSGASMMAKGGETNYTKKWKVVGITMQGKRFEKEITLGRMSDRNDVMNALKRMPDTQIREITFIGERFKAADGGMMAKGGGVEKFNQGDKFYDSQEQRLVEIKNVRKDGVIEFHSITEDNDFYLSNSLLKKGLNSGVWFKISDELGMGLKAADGGMMAKGGEVRYKLAGNNFGQQIESGKKFAELIKKAHENQTSEHKYPENFIKEIAYTGKIVKNDGTYFLKDYSYKGVLDRFEFLGDKYFLESLKYLNRPTIKNFKFEDGGMMAKGGIYSSDSLYILKVSKDGKEVGEERFRAKNKREAREMGEDYEEKYKSKFGGDLSFSVKEAESKMAKGGKLKIGGEDFSYLLELTDKELSKRLDLVRKQQDVNGKQYFEAKSKNESTQKIEDSRKNLDNQERAIIEARVRKMASGGKVKFADKVKSVQESLLKRKKVAPQVQKDYGKTYSKVEAKESAQRIVGSRMAQLKEKMAKKKK